MSSADVRSNTSASSFTPLNAQQSPQQVTNQNTNYNYQQYPYYQGYANKPFDQKYNNNPNPNIPHLVNMGYDQSSLSNNASINNPSNLYQQNNNNNFSYNNTINNVNYNYQGNFLNNNIMPSPNVNINPNQFINSQGLNNFPNLSNANINNQSNDTFFTKYEQVILQKMDELQKIIQEAESLRNKSDSLYAIDNPEQKFSPRWTVYTDPFPSLWYNEKLSYDHFDTFSSMQPIYDQQTTANNNYANYVATSNDNIINHNKLPENLNGINNNVISPNNIIINPNYLNTNIYTNGTNTNSYNSSNNTNNINYYNSNNTNNDFYYKYINKKNDYYSNSNTYTNSKKNTSNNRFVYTNNDKNGIKKSSSSEVDDFIPQKKPTITITSAPKSANMMPHNQLPSSSSGNVSIKVTANDSQKQPNEGIQINIQKHGQPDPNDIPRPQSNPVHQRQKENRFFYQPRQTTITSNSISNPSLSAAAADPSQLVSDFVPTSSSHLSSSDFAPSFRHASPEPQFNNNPNGYRRAQQTKSLSSCNTDDNSNTDSDQSEVNNNIFFYSKNNTNDEVSINSSITDNSNYYDAFKPKRINSGNSTSSGPQSYNVYSGKKKGFSTKNFANNNGGKKKPSQFYYKPSE